MRAPPLTLFAASSRVAMLLASLLLAGCAAVAPVPGPELTGVRFAPVTLPKGIARSNRDLAQDFLELTFALEFQTALQHSWAQDQHAESGGESESFLDRKVKAVEL